MRSSGRIRFSLAAALAAVLLGPSALAEPPVAPDPPAAAPSQDPDFERLKALVEEAEKLLDAKKEDMSAVRAEEAEVLVADWPIATLKREDVAQLLERLRTVQKALQMDEGLPQEPEPGLKVNEEVVNLTGEDLTTELNRVKSAEAGAHFDFPIDLNDKVLTWVHAFTGAKRGFMEGALSRASQYLPMVRQIFSEEGVPQDLAYLAVIESGYRNVAHSPAAAVGMWQFIRSTGRIYGLGGNSWVEERRDPVKATHAAARYLKRLYQVTGDWYLALASYDAGPLTIDRAAQALSSRNFWDMHRSRYLRNETKNYVPEMCAAVLIGHFPDRYGLNIVQQPPYAFEEVAVDRMTSLNVLAKFAGTDAGALRDLNPELLRATTPPGRYTLRVPPGTSGVTARALAQIPASQRLDFKTYKLRRGDTLARVAARFKVSPEDLLTANGMRKAEFRPGRKIQVPPASTLPIDEQDLLPKVERARTLEDKPLESIPVLPAPKQAEASIPAPEKPAENVEAAREPAAKATPEPKPASGKAREALARPKAHVVKRGETVFSIAERYGLEAKDLLKWNKIKKNRIKPGQKLRLQKP